MKVSNMYCKYCKNIMSLVDPRFVMTHTPYDIYTCDNHEICIVKCVFYGNNDHFWQICYNKYIFTISHGACKTRLYKINNNNAYDHICCAEYVDETITPETVDNKLKTYLTFQ